MAIRNVLSVWVAIIFSLFILLFSTQAGTLASSFELDITPDKQLVDDPLINEFLINHTGSVDVDFVEILAESGTDLSGLTILLVEGDSTGNPGKVIASYTGGITDFFGYWVADLEILALDDGTTTLLLVSNYSGDPQNEDLDETDDGVFNEELPWDDLLDSVSIHDGESGDFVYSETVLRSGYDGLPGLPGGASRIPNGVDTNSVDDWMRNDFDLSGMDGYDGTATMGEALNTPEEKNLAVPLINEFVYNHDGADNFEFFEIIGTPLTDYSRVNLLVVESDTTLQQGQITNVVSFLLPTNESGYEAVFAQSTQSIADNSVTLLLVYGFTGTAGQNLDMNDDGILDDDAPWTSLIDSVGVLDDLENLDDHIYSNVILEPGYDGNSDYPGGASRIPIGVNTETVADWMRNNSSFAGIPNDPSGVELNEAANTPGEENWGFLESNDLIVTMTGPDYLDPDDQLIYHVTVENLSIVKALDAKLTDTLPADTSYVFDTSGLSVTNPALGKYEWDLGDLQPGYKLVFDLTLQLSADTELGWITNTINLSSLLPELNADNNLVVKKSIIRQKLLINEIQGAAHKSPKEGYFAVEVPGIVTALTATGFYMQSPAYKMDDQLSTSEGILVDQAQSPSVSVGDHVLVTATVSEHYPDSYIENGLSTTELVGNPDVTNMVVDVLSSGNSLPMPTLIGEGGQKPSTEIISDDSTNNVEESLFDPISDGIDFYESLEGMLVSVNGAISVGPTNNDGEIPIVPDGGSWATTLNPRGGIYIQPLDFNPERILIDDVFFGTPELDTGSVFSAAITGILDYSLGNYKLMHTSDLPVAAESELGREVTELVRDNDQITVATLNVKNLDPGDTHFTELANQIVAHLDSPDIVVLQEIQDNSGSFDDGTTAANLTYEALITAIQEVPGPTYAYVDIAPQDNMDGGMPGGNIRVGFLYRCDRGLEFVSRLPVSGEDLAVINTTLSVGTTGVELSYNPGRIDPNNQAWDDSRKPLVGEFIFNHRKLFVIGNHFNSKKADTPLFGRLQPPVLDSETQRMQQAQVVNSFVNQILALDPTALVVVAGDLNDYQFSNPLLALEGDMLTNLHSLNPIEEQYTYIYDGNSQAIDHILASDQLMASGVEMDVVHINAEFGDRASDHDPLLARFTLPAVKVNLVQTTYQVNESVGSLTIMVRLDASSTETVTVDFTTSDNAATAVGDYIATSGMLSFFPMQPTILTKEIVISILEDDIAEYQEDFFLTLSNAITANLGSLYEATICIIDDDWRVYLPVIVR